MLPRCILSSPARGGRSHWRDTVKIVHDRIRRWRAGDLFGLWAEVEESDAKLNRRKKTKKLSQDSLHTANATRARCAVEDGQYRKAIQVLSSDGLSPITKEVHDAMLTNTLNHPTLSPTMMSHPLFASPRSVLSRPLGLSLMVLPLAPHI